MKKEGIANMAVHPRETDVMCGTGSETVHHPGNVAFRATIMRHFDEYILAETKRDKMRISKAVLMDLVDSGARFLKKDPIYQQWYVADLKVGKDKISHCLREMKATRIRKRDLPTILQAMRSEAKPVPTVSGSEKPIPTDFSCDTVLEDQRTSAEGKDGESMDTTQSLQADTATSGSSIANARHGGARPMAMSGLLELMHSGSASMVSILGGGANVQGEFATMNAGGGSRTRASQSHFQHPTVASPATSFELRQETKSGIHLSNHHHERDEVSSASVADLMGTASGLPAMLAGRASQQGAAYADQSLSHLSAVSPLAASSHAEPSSAMFSTVAGDTPLDRFIIRSVQEGEAAASQHEEDGDDDGN